MQVNIREVDPQGSDALLLLRQAAEEARALYPELHGPNAPWPGNAPTSPRGVYLMAYRGSQPIAMGAHRPMDATCTELRRMFTLASARRQGVSRAVLLALERHARLQSFSQIKLETGNRQLAALALYQSMGYQRIEAFGPYQHDPTSVCLAKMI